MVSRSLSTESKTASDKFQQVFFDFCGDTPVVLHDFNKVIRDAFGEVSDFAGRLVNRRKSSRAIKDGADFGEFL